MSECNDWDLIPKELFDKVQLYCWHFFEIHQTEDIKKYIIKCTKNDIVKNRNIYNLVNIVNYSLSWANTKEGYHYYYFLNLRFNIGLLYLFAEYDNKKYSKYFIKTLKGFMGFSSSLGISRNDFFFSETKMKYYKEKIKKLEKIFGN